MSKPPPFLHSGELYDPMDLNLTFLRQLHYQNRLRRFNKTHCSLLGLGVRALMLKVMLAEVGKGCYIEPPFHANFGGHHVHLGDHVYANYGFTCVDDTHIYIGDRTMIAPNVVIATAAHPLLPALRAKGLQYNKPIHIGKDVWIGSGALIMPGITVGDGTVIGAGSVVTKDLPANVIAVGNPCRVLREINEHDRAFFDKDKAVPPEFLSCD
ncbi:MAG: sugar O-acetyltransferase [Oscillospiraceae bacterium]|jgi:galactoside O-acetyltransferase|nr:sugar O-acetyltransferase [Oscillospiraceae bacterium]